MQTDKVSIREDCPNVVFSLRYILVCIVGLTGSHPHLIWSKVIKKKFIFLQSFVQSFRRGLRNICFMDCQREIKQ